MLVQSAEVLQLGGPPSPMTQLLMVNAIWHVVPAGHPAPASPADELEPAPEELDAPPELEAPPLDPPLALPPPSPTLAVAMHEDWHAVHPSRQLVQFAAEQPAISAWH